MMKIKTTDITVAITIAVLFALLPLRAAAGPVVWFGGSEAVGYSLDVADAPVVRTALTMFASDMRAATGYCPVEAKGAKVNISTITGRNAKALRRLGLPVDSLLGCKDAFAMRACKGRLYVVGADARGTAYGILELSRMAGVSPWVWWGDATPQRRQRLEVAEGFAVFQAPSVEYRGVFINDEDWSLRPWSGGADIGPKTYKRIFQLLLRLRANTIWPAMHEGTTAFYRVEGNREMADSCGIVVGTSHCEPMMRNNVGEWDRAKRGAYNYITNRDAVQTYWAERLDATRATDCIYSLGMRGIHDGTMEGVRTNEEKLTALQQVVDDQRAMLAEHLGRSLADIPQQFVPYKEVLEIMDRGLRVPDDVCLTWCDDNYGYMTRLSDSIQRRRQGGAGVYYHLSYWGRPHDYLWLTTTQPGLIYNEMRMAWDTGARRLWIANVHDPKAAAYDLELFLDMAWNINAVGPQTLYAHQERWLCREFGPAAGRAIAPAMRRYYWLCGARRPEFMGWSQVELDRKKYPRGLSPISPTEFTADEAKAYLAHYADIRRAVEAAEPLVPAERRAEWFAAVRYPLVAAGDMARKVLADSIESRKAYDEIQALTHYYNKELSGGKWDGLMSAAPRGLPVFGRREHPNALAEPRATYAIARNACDYVGRGSGGPCGIQSLGHSMAAVPLPKGRSLDYRFDSPQEGEAILRTAVVPTQPSDKGDIRISVSIDGGQPQTISYKEPFRSEQWKRNVLRGQAIITTRHHISKGPHTLTITAADDHVVLDQWAIAFGEGSCGYMIPAEPEI